MLTKCGDKIITYDVQVNPTSYLGRKLTWEKGRQLKSIDNNIYAYNANGVRVSKNISGVLHTFFLEGTKIVCEKWNSNVMIPLYDNEDIVCGIIYNNVPYYFHRNLQNDIIAIVDKTGNVLARYTYDAWGACICATGEGEIANINPFRYRGYYCDVETGYYYLQSRYYDPTTGRFLNSDDIKYLGTTDCSVGFNLFSYCDNNPVNRSDVNGHSWISDRFNDVKNAAGKIAKAISNTAQKVASTAKNVTTTVKNAVVNTAKKVATTVTNATRSLVTTVSGVARDAVDWTKNKINDITDGVKKAAIKAKEAVVEAWNWTIKKAIPAVGKFFNETVWKKWIVGGVWETFCKDWVWETFCKDWVWETFCKEWVRATLCKKWVWQTVLIVAHSTANQWLMDKLTKFADGKENLSIITTSIEKSNENYKKNRPYYLDKQWRELKSFIDNQHTDVANLVCCNNRKLTNVGCGLIAIYNIELLKSNFIDLIDVVYWFEQNDGFILNGVFGVNPNTIPVFFDMMGRVTTKYTNVADLEQSRQGTGHYIVCQWNDPYNITKGAHYFAVKDEDDVLTPYNNGDDDLSTTYANFQSILNAGGALICAYRID